MTVTASFQPEQLAAEPGQLTSLSLHLQNNATEQRTITLSVSGELANQTLLSTRSVQLDAGEHFELPVTIDAQSTLSAGSHACVVNVASQDETTTATAAIEIGLVTGWTAHLAPVHSSGSSRGRHKVALENHGNAPITLAIFAAGETEVVTEVAAASVDIAGGASTNVALRVIPATRFWNGPPIEHPFTATVRCLEGDLIVDTVEIEGLYEQRPRIPIWTAPALAGMLGALLIAVLAWFALIKPAVENIAQDEARELDMQQQAVLDDQIDAMQAAADEAASLPLGDPTDLRMSVSASSATTSSEAFDFDKAGNGRVLSITDVIFQNPSGAIGRLELLRDDEVLLDQEMSNFRDLDFHLVSALTVESESTISLRLTCETPGPGTSDCEAAATIVGFVDDL